MLLSYTGYTQIDYNIYVGMTKRQIIQSFKSDNFTYNFYQKLYVKIDSVGKWDNNENYYTWIVDYSIDDTNKVKGLFTFNNDGYCESYFLMIRKLDYYWNYFQYYSQTLEKSKTKDLTWIEKRRKFFVQITLTPVNPAEITIYAEKKNYTLNK